MIDWMKMPSLASLRVFEAVGRTSSQAQAAAALNITQAAVSQHIRALEKALDVELVVRQTRGVMLTDVGQRLHQQLRDGFDTIYSAILAIESEREARPLRVTLPTLMAENWLMPLMGSFWEKHPSIMIEILPTETLVPLSTVDLAIRFGEGNWPNVTYHGFIQRSLVLVATPSFIASNQHIDLVDWNWVCAPTKSDQILLQSALSINELPKNIRCYPTQTMCRAALLSGLGAGIFSESAVESEVARRELQIVKNYRTSAQMGYYIISAAPLRDPRLMAFVKWLKAQ